MTVLKNKLNLLAPIIINSLWLAQTWKGAYAWEQASLNTKKTQQKVLLRILKSNSDTVFGQIHEFDKITDYKTYQKQVPLTDYNKYYKPWLKRAENGEKNVLTKDNIFLFEPTSGSTRDAKLIPYTRSLKNEFIYGSDPWIHFLFREYPKALTGTSYWSVTPPMGKKNYTTGGIPIGFDDDSAYLPQAQKKLFDAVNVVRGDIKNDINYIQFRQKLLFHLLSAENIGIISIWNPTYLTVLLKNIKSEIPQIVEKLHKSGNIKRSVELHNILNLWKCHDPFSRIIKNKTMYEIIWPRLSVISCWADAFAKKQAEYLRENFFPNTCFQRKGLLSTEALISFPKGRNTGPVLSLNSHFFEFISEKGDIIGAHELEKGLTYEVAVTTGGGLYRYRTNDLVEVTGFHNSCPVIRFLGKKDKVVDLVGEKLNEVQVQQIAEALFKKHDIAPVFWMMAPKVEKNNYSYTLFMEGVRDEKLLKKFAKQLDEILGELNIYYGQARKYSHQLNGLSVFKIERQGADTYLDVCTQNGQKRGNIKPSMLHKYECWDTKFKGKFL